MPTKNARVKSFGCRIAVCLKRDRFRYRSFFLLGGVGNVQLQPVSIRLRPDGKYEAIPGETQTDVARRFSQADMDAVVNALEDKLNAMKEDNVALKV